MEKADNTPYVIMPGRHCIVVLDQTRMNLLRNNILSSAGWSHAIVSGISVPCDQVRIGQFVAWEKTAFDSLTKI